MTENHKLRIEELTKAGILDLEDLEINKSGHLSQRQIRMLYLNLAFWLTLAGFDLVILALFIYFQMFFQGNLTTGIIWGSLINSSCYLVLEIHGESATVVVTTPNNRRQSPHGHSNCSHLLYL